MHVYYYFLQPRVYAFENSGPEREFEPRYIVPEDSSTPLQGTSEPVIPEAAQFREEYSYSPDSVYDGKYRTKSSYYRRVQSWIVK